ncbi:hypothetical protein AB0393_28330 [Streptomyces cyaneofuscatus]|uniref:hypothetical protein n=1 Tax=Streptomyces cyaneofuscatus TaxID=66883 RepID=UPI00344F8D5A
MNGSALPGQRRPAPGRRRGGPGRTMTVLYDSAHLRVRVRGEDVVWFVRDVAAALGIRLPLTPGSEVPPVLVTTAELDARLAAAGVCPPRAFTAWAQDLARQLPRQA